MAIPLLRGRLQSPTTIPAALGSHLLGHFTLDPKKEYGAVETFRVFRKIRMSDADVYGNVHNLSIIAYTEDLAIEFVTAQRDETGVQTFWGTAQVEAMFSIPLPWTLSEAETRLVVEKLERAGISRRTDVISTHNEHASVRARYVRFDSTGSRY